MQTLQNLIDMRLRELQNSKNQANIYKQQFEIINIKANERFSGEK